MNAWLARAVWIALGVVIATVAGSFADRAVSAQGNPGIQVYEGSDSSVTVSFPGSGSLSIPAGIPVDFPAGSQGFPLASGVVVSFPAGGNISFPNPCAGAGQPKPRVRVTGANIRVAPRARQ